MALLGYTPGGSPIFFGGNGKTYKTKNKNPRFKCKDCKAKTTKNQRKVNGNCCFQCKKPFNNRID